MNPMNESLFEAEARFRAIARLVANADRPDGDHFAGTWGITFGEVRSLVTMLDRLFRRCTHPSVSPPKNTIEATGQDTIDGSHHLGNVMACCAMNADQALKRGTDIHQAVEKAINEVISKRERALSLALSLALDLPSQRCCLAAAIQNRDRLACVKTPTAAWYYVDGRCIYGHSLMETLWTEVKFSSSPPSVTVREETLNPSDAPALQPPTPPAAPTPDPEEIYRMPTEGITHRLPRPEDEDGGGVIQVLKDSCWSAWTVNMFKDHARQFSLFLPWMHTPGWKPDPSVLKDQAIARVKDGRAYYDSADKALILAALEAMPAERAKQPPSC